MPRSRSKRLHDAFARLLTRYLEGGLGGVSGKVPVQITATLTARTVDGAPGAPPCSGRERSTAGAVTDPALVVRRA